MHQRTLPLVLAAMPALKRAAAAPSSAPLPPPATSCSAPRASPRPGRRSSTSGIPKGSTVLERAPLPSILSIVVLSLAIAPPLSTSRPLSTFLFCSPERGRESRAAWSAHHPGEGESPLLDGVELAILGCGFLASAPAPAVLWLEPGSCRWFFRSLGKRHGQMLRFARRKPVTFEIKLNMHP